MKRLTILAIAMLAMAFCVSAQIVNPVKWKSAVKMTDDTHGVVTFTASIDKGWHLYNTKLPDGGPVATSVEWTQKNGVTLDGGLTPSTKPREAHDATFDMTLSWWENGVTLTQKFTATGSKFNLKGNIRYMACNDATCSSPTTEPFNLSGTAKTGDATASTADSATAPVTDTVAAPAPVSISPDTDTWAPVTFDQGNSTGDITTNGSAATSLWVVFGTCFLGGLLALLTPCVWPIIPMTVSFFLKRSGSRRKSIANAVTYGVSIIVIYVALGLIVTAIFGPSTLNAIATNAVCNIAFFLLLVVFALSFFGAFDIKLPSSWSNSADSAAERTTGLVSIFFMAFTLAIVSFSCTGPIIGTLLVEAANQGNRMGPAVGMLGFSIALAIPFTLFALFPSWLKKMPRSGGWLNTVKVVLGFLELILSLKFLSVADMAYGWHILDREVFLALWIAMFLLLGLYLMGKFRFKSDGEPDGHGIGVTRFTLALASLAFTAYLLPGLWGAPLRATSAFVPPLSTQDFNLYGDDSAEWDDYDKGMAAAAASGKPVFLDFSGYGCVNCRKMDGAVLDNSEVKDLINKNFTVIKLMVDDKTSLDQPRQVEENGRVVELTTAGDLWSYLQRHKFNSNSQPYYVILNPDGTLRSGPVAYDEDVNRFVDFLKKGLNN